MKFHITFTCLRSDFGAIQKAVHDQFHIYFINLGEPFGYNGKYIKLSNSIKSPSNHSNAISEQDLTSILKFIIELFPSILLSGDVLIGRDNDPTTN